MVTPTPERRHCECPRCGARAIHILETDHIRCPGCGVYEWTPSDTSPNLTH